MTKKAGTVLINIENKKVALVNRRDNKGFEFPKGHLEENETLEQCAIRETEEETGRKNHLISNDELGIIKYITSKGESVELHMYLAIDDGITDKNIANEDKEEWDWIDIDEVEHKLDFSDLQDFWKENIKKIKQYIGG